MDLKDRHWKKNKLQLVYAVRLPLAVFADAPIVFPEIALQKGQPYLKVQIWQTACIEKLNWEKCFCNAWYADIPTQFQAHCSC